MPRLITGTPPRRPSRVAALLAAPAAAALLLSGCSAGQISQTDQTVAAIPGANADSPGGVASLRDVQIKYNNPQGYRAGATAPLVLAVVNNDVNRPLVLRSVSAAVSRGGPSLGTVVLTGGAADIEGNVSASASASRPAAPSASATASATVSASASASASASGSASATPSSSASGSATPGPTTSAVINLRIPPNSYARLAAESGGYLAITAITSALNPGSSVYLTFTFDRDEPTEVVVPFGVPLSPPPRLQPSSTPGGE